MSLIPSESLNFPDSFRANVGWRLDDPDDQPETESPRQQVAANNPFPQPVETPKAGVEPPAPAPATTPQAIDSKASEAVAPSSLPEPQNVVDDQHLELIANTPTETKPADSAPGPGEMNALLQYFMAAGAAPAAVPDRPNGQSAVQAENVATIAAVIPANVPVESPVATTPNEPPIIVPVKVEPVNASPAAESNKESAVPDNAPSPQQSIVAALQSLSHTDVEPPISSVEVQTPAQANHIMELIAAAVQRGALIGEPIPQSDDPVAQPALTEPAPSPPTPPPAPGPAAPASPVPGFSIAREPVSKSTEIPPRAPEPIFSIPIRSPIVPEQPPVAEPQAPIRPAAPDQPTPPMADVAATPVEPTPIASAPAPSTSDIAKAPAKIRITPRKIKPRPQPQPISDEPITSARVSEVYPAEAPREAKVSPIVDRRTEASGKPETKSAPKSLESPEALAPRAELSARRIAAARLEIAQSDPFLFNARERRNRWIGFGLSELAVVTALVLLGRFAFNHHFPDPALKILVFILLFAAAAVAIALPIAFLRNDPQRWNRVGR